MTSSNSKLTYLSCSSSCDPLFHNFTLFPEIQNKKVNLKMSTQVYKNKWKHFPMLNPTYCLPLSESLSSESPSFFFFLLRVFLSSPDKSDTADTSEGLDESDLESDLSSSKSEPAESSKKSDSSLIAL